MSRSARFTLTLLALLCLPGVGHAHHYHLQVPFKAAFARKNINAMRPVFTEAAWEAGRELHGLHRKSLRSYLTVGGAVSTKRAVMALQLSFEGEPHPRFYMLLARRSRRVPESERPSLVVKIGGKVHASGWVITRVTRSFPEARKFIGQSLDYIFPQVPRAVLPNDRRAGHIAERLNARLDLARNKSMPAAWERDDPESPRRVFEELRERSVIVIPRESRGPVKKGARMTVRLWLWNLEKGEFEPDRHALIRHGTSRWGAEEWLLDAVTKDAKKAAAYPR